jgi:hypothetical protein
LSYTDTSVANGTTYYYVVSAWNSSGEGANSAEATARPLVAPPAPPGLTATAGYSQVALSWTAAAGATSYNVKRSLASGAEVTMTNVTSANFTDANVSNGTAYYYVVSGVNGAGQGPNSAEVSAVPTASGMAMNCGSTNVYGRFVGDANYSAGSFSVHANTIIITNLVNPAPYQVYQSYHIGTSFNYTYPGLLSGLYTVRLHFCETYTPFTNGSRIFNVAINGTQVLPAFDIYAAAGSANRAIIQEFTARPNSTNAIVIQFDRLKDNAAINAIELVPILPLTPFQLWQIQYFGSTNNPLAAPNADASGTGQNNLFKYIAGLDPTNPGSVFTLQMSASASGPSLSFGPIAANRLYNVQTRADLLSGSWSALSSTAPPVTNGNRMYVTDTNTGPATKYYRVGITLP